MSDKDIKFEAESGMWNMGRPGFTFIDNDGDCRLKIEFQFMNDKDSPWVWEIANVLQGILKEKGYKSVCEEEE